MQSDPSKYKIFIIKSISLLLYLFIFYLTFLLLTLSYSSVTTGLIQHYSITQSKAFYQILSPSKWYGLQGISIIIALACLADLLMNFRYTLKLYFHLEYYFIEIRKITQKYVRPTLSIRQKILLIGTLLLLLFWRAYHLQFTYFHIDEIATYLYFTSKGFLVSMSYYPAPNNHVLYTLATCWSALFIKAPMWIMKAPSFLISIGLSYLIFLFFNKRFSFTTALIGMLIFSLSFPIHEMSLMGRGYLLQTLFVLVSVECACKITQDHNYKKIYGTLLIISCMLGFYTIPTFLYPFSSIYAYFLIHSLAARQYSYLLIHLKNLGATLLGVLVLYSPIIALQGWGSLVHNPWVKPQSFSSFKASLLKLFKDQFNYLLGSHTEVILLIVLVLMIGIFCLLFIKKRPYLLPLCLIIVPLLLLMIHHVLPPKRIWTYQSFTWVWLILLLLGQLKKPLQTSILLLLTAFLLIQNKHSIQTQKKVKENYQEASLLTCDLSFQSSMYTNHDVLNMTLRLHAHNQQYQSPLVIDLHYRDEEVYTYLILSKYQPPPPVSLQKYQLIREGQWVTIYQIK